MSGQMILALCGYPRTGKDTIAEHLVASGGWERIAFADPMRESLYRLDPLVTNPFTVGMAPFQSEVRHLSSIVDEYGWDWAKENCHEVRGYLQRMGTEAGRDIHGENCWVDAADRKICKLIKDGKSVVITDMRFPNEVAYVDRFEMRMGVRTLKLHVLRPGFGKVNDHVSEQLSYWDIADATLVNDGPVEKLLENLKGIIG